MWRRRFARTLADLPAGRVLDVGSGLGTFLAIAAEAGWTVDGTEVSRTAIRHARERHGVALRLGHLQEAAPPGPYDAICLWHVLEHLPDPVDALRYCAARLVPGGRIVLAMPNDGDAAWAPTVIGNLVRTVWRRPPTRRYERLRPGVESHIQHFDARSLTRLLAATGFELERLAVDDASPTRSRLGSIAYRLRVGLTAITPWHFGREMLAIAHRR